MTAADAAAVADLATQLGYPTEPAAIAERLKRIGTRGATDILLVAADEADTPVGWAHVELRDTLVAPPAAQLMALVVGEGARNRGIGRDLLGAAEAWAAGHGCSILMVATRVTREDAHRFYRREGYDLDKTSHIFHKALPAGDSR
ncbi:MAG TPA: GNAT family N-acetyltransferase [Candidatus Limnocylindria bacterium]|jgi:GNAT superfamily N-acetyltransferase